MVYFPTFSLYFIDIYAESWSFRPEKLPATFGSGLASSTSLCRRRVPRILGAKAEGETSSSALVIWGFLWVVSLNGGWNPPPFHKPQVFWSIFSRIKPILASWGISPTNFRRRPPQKRGMREKSPPQCSISFFFLTHEVPEPERKSGGQKWVTHVIFCKGLLGDHYNHPAYLHKKTSIMVFCVVWKEPIAGFCWAVHQSRSCRDTLKLAVRQIHRIFFDWWIGAEVLGEMRSVFKQQAMWAMRVLPTRSGVAKFGEPS